jgi:ABC-2 type transport system permease protein
MPHYNQVKAMFAITKASLRGQFRSPSAVLFSFAFPFIFILVFGFIGKNTGVPVFKIALSKNCDTANALFDSIKKSSSIKIVSFASDQELRDYLVKGKLAGVLTITKNSTAQPAYRYTLATTSASNDKWPQLLPLINSIVNTISNQQYTNRPTFAASDFDAARDVEVIRESILYYPDNWDFLF